MLTITYKAQEHVPALDGLRGVAIAMLLFYHCFPNLYKLGVGLSWVGVDLFLVLSGFLITGTLLDTKGQDNFFSRFYFRRALRVFPLYYIFLFAFFIAMPYFAPVQWAFDYAFYFEHQNWYWLHLSNWLIVFQNHWPLVSKPILDHLWLLSLEAQFCLIWPLIVYVLNKHQLLYFSAFFILVGFLLRNLFVHYGLSYSTSYVFTFSRFDGICVGSSIAILIRNDKTKPLLASWSPSILYGSFLVLGTIVFISRSISLKDVYFIRFGYTTLSFLFGALLVYALTSKTWTAQITNSLVFKWLGKHSYGIYLLHWFLYPLLAEKFNVFFAFLHNPFLIELTTSLVCTIIILIGATLSWNLMEKHFLRLKKQHIH